MIKEFEIFTNNVSIIYRGIAWLKSEKMKELGLKGNHVMCLFYLEQHDEGLTASNLCELVGVDKAAVSRSLSELYKSEYIDYENFSGGKKYNTTIKLTEKGKEVTAVMIETIRSVVDEVSLSNMSEDERTAMYRALRKIANNIKEYIQGEKI